MDAELNAQIKQFLKKVSVSIHREIEQSIYAALESAQLKGDETLPVKVTLSLSDLDLQHQVSGFITLK